MANQSTESWECQEADDKKGQGKALHIMALAQVPDLQSFELFP